MSRSLLFFLSLLLFLLLVAAAHDGDHDKDSSSSSSDQQVELRSKSLILAKIWCLILIFVGTLVAGISPYFLKWNEAFLVLGTQFAGGVFLGAALMHFLSDANRTFSHLTEKKYPFAFMLASAGYLLTMLADCAVSYVYSKKEEEQSSRSSADLEVPGSIVQGKGSSENGATHHHDASIAFGSLGDSILLIIALCFHSVFEGIAIGVAQVKADAWKVLWTVCLHKMFAAIAMGIALLRMIPNRSLLSCVSYACAFAISSPIGVAIGIIIDATTQGVVPDWIYAISMGLACGVFVYVSINHLLSKGYVPQRAVSVDTPIHKFLAMTLGVGVIAVVMIWDT